MKSRKTVLGTMVLASAFLAASARAAIVATNNNFIGSSSIDGWYSFQIPGKADGTEAEILYLNGAGPRYDWADNDNSAVQSALSTGDTLPPGGTITGDGLLADGALLVDSVDTNAGNEYVAFTLGGTAEEGETVNFEFSAFNQVEYYSQMQGQLWDITAGKELADSAWVIPLSTSATNYIPITGTLSYLVPSHVAGHQLAIVFREWHNSTARQGYIDNISVTTSLNTKPGIVSFANNFEEASSSDGWYLFTSTGTGQYIGRLSGAGPRYDWADNNDLVAQSAVATESNWWVVANGGTITGDGNLADGGLMWVVGDTTKGNERIAYNLSGTTATGEVLTLTFNLYNNKDYYNQVTGYFYDLTTSEQLMPDSWISTKAITDAVYAPVDKVVTYTVPPERVGHQMAIVFREWHNSTQRVIYFDNLSVTSELPATPESLYQDWGESEGLTGANDDYAQNPDGDLLDNLAEYALGGQPTNSANQGIASTYGTMEEGGTNWVTYVYARRSDYAVRGLDYYLETTSDLVYAGWTNDNYEVVGIDITGGNFDYVTNRVPTIGESEQFLRVGIEITP